MISLSRVIDWILFENMLQSINEYTNAMSCSCFLTAENYEYFYEYMSE